MDYTPLTLNFGRIFRKRKVLGRAWVDICRKQCLRKTRPGARELAGSGESGSHRPEGGSSQYSLSGSRRRKNAGAVRQSSLCGTRRTPFARCEEKRTGTRSPVRFKGQAPRSRLAGTDRTVLLSACTSDENCLREDPWQFGRHPRKMLSTGERRAGRRRFLQGPLGRKFPARGEGA